MILAAVRPAGGTLSRASESLGNDSGSGPVPPDMDPAIGQALAQGGIVDITTTGRKSGRARRIEIYLHNLDGVFYLTGRPGFPRDWVANLTADPRMTLHLKRGVSADLAATAEVITDPQEKGEIILRARVESWGANPDVAMAELDHWVATSPLVRFSVD